MGAVAFAGEDECLPSTSNGKKYKLPTTLLDGYDGVNHALVPRKLRSAIKKRGRESITPLLPISRKQHYELIGVDILKKDGAKKAKLNMRGHITKDEAEVAETLYALAGMFSDADKVDRPGLDDEPRETKSSAILQEGSSISAAEDTPLKLREKSRKNSSKVIQEAASHSSNMVDSTEKVVNSQSLGAQQHEFFSSKQPATLSVSGVQSLSSRCITNSINDKYNDSFLSPNLSATRALRSGIQRSCQRFPAWSESTNFTSQPCLIENNTTREKHPQVATQPKKSWKRCSAHIYISRLIKVLQISDRREGLSEKPTQLTSSGGAELSSHNQMAGLNGINGAASFSGIYHCAAQNNSSEIQDDICSQKRPVEDQEMASECTVKQGHDFLSLGTGFYGLDAGERVNRAGCSHEPSKEFHASQNYSTMLFSPPQNCYSSTLHGHNSPMAAQQVQLNHYRSGAENNSFTARKGQQLELQRQKWAAQLQTHYNTGGGVAPSFPDWNNGGRDAASVLNYAHALFPCLHAALGSKYQQLSPPQPQAMAINSLLPVSNMKRHHHHHHHQHGLSLGFERNGVAFHP